MIPPLPTSLTHKPSYTTTPLSMDAPLDSTSFPHFALLYIDDNGKLCFEASSSVADDCHHILSPEVTHSFLRAVAMSGDEIKPSNPYESPIDNRCSYTPNSFRTSPTSRRSSRQDYPQHDNPRKRARLTNESMVPMSMTSFPRTMLPISNTGLVRKYYEKAFDSLQQINCRILAKAYIRLVEPRKQVNYPYNGRRVIFGSSQKLDPEATKPAWWPRGVTHREPDHLRKPERIRLLVHILCELRESHGITAEKLKEADQSIRRQICPVQRLQVLDEIYHVRAQEESYLNGEASTSTTASIYHVDLPELSDAQLPSNPSSDALIDSSSSSEPRLPDLESPRHTSVRVSNTSSSPPSDLSLSLSTSQTDQTTPPSPSTVPIPSAPPSTTWDVCAPAAASSAALPPTHLTTSSKPHDARSAPCTLAFSTEAPIYPHHEQATTLEMSPFAMGYYSCSNTQPQMQLHLAPGAPHAEGHPHFNPLPGPVMQPAAVGCVSDPYYFGF
ncbi:hypothetical protein BJX61DRAFT_549070 [Aspergillus egyptiacus]|nr:hypothetical protein BJX61DRAFT_549070 [Aspergillus egyptiacus]